MVSAVRAASVVAEWFGPFAAVVGHSFGGAVAFNAVAGSIDGIAPVAASKLVLIAAPSSMPHLFRDFGRFLNLGPRTQSAVAEEVRRIAGRPLDDFDGSQLLRSDAGADAGRSRARRPRGRGRTRRIVRAGRRPRAAALGARSWPPAHPVRPRHRGGITGVRCAPCRPPFISQPQHKSWARNEIAFGCVDPATGRYAGISRGCEAHEQHRLRNLWELNVIGMNRYAAALHPPCGGQMHFRRRIEMDQQ